MEIKSSTENSYLSVDNSPENTGLCQLPTINYKLSGVLKSSKF